MSDDDERPGAPGGDERAAAPSSDPGDEEHAELARLLLRSARLDVPRRTARDAALARGLDALRAPRRGRRTVLAAAALALAVAAAVALVMRHTPPKNTQIAAERVVTVTRAPELPVPQKMPRPCSALVVAKGTAPLIEDFEQDDSWVLSADGRKGSWMTYDDGTGTQDPPSRSALFPSRIPGGRGASKHGLHLKGGRFTKWGVTFGTELADAACYDASAYAGIELWAKGPGELRVGLQMIDVQDVKYGGFCQKDCYDTHRKIIELGPTFRKYAIRWDELHQLFAADPPVAFDPRRVRFLEFGIAPERTPFDIWIDDVSFIVR